MFNKYYLLLLRLNNNSYIISIKTAFFKILPLFVIHSFNSLIFNLLFHFKFYESHILIFNLFQKIKTSTLIPLPYIFIFLFSNQLFYLKNNKYNMQSSFYSVIGLFIYNYTTSNRLLSKNNSIFFISIIIGILNYFLYFSLNKINFFIKKKYVFLKEITIGFFILGFFGTLSLLIYKLFPYFSLDLTSKFIFDNSLLTALKYNFIILIPWLFGINGSHLVESSYNKLFHNTSENIQAILNHTNNFHYIDQSFFDLYVNIGGNGSTFCLILALFLSQKKNNKKFAELAFIPSIFNINEILIYGLPIVANIYYIIPFLLVPSIFTILSYGALKFHIIPIASTHTFWMTPSLIGGIISGNGDPRIVIWQIFLIFLGTMIYYCFIKNYNSINSFNISKEHGFINNSYSRLDMSEIQLNFILDANKAKQELNKLLDQGEFLLYFQPIVNVKNNSIEKMEALIRIKNKKLGIIHPYFLEYFRTLNKIVVVDYWVIEKSFEYGKLLETENKNIDISINISVETFNQPQFIEKLALLAKKHKIKEKKFTLEILEEACFNNLDLIRDKIMKLRLMGYKIAIDDFGTGYSSLSYLLELSVDYIKIDKKFILNSNSDKGKKILKSIVDLCHSINCITIVEGVEKEAELSIAKSLDIELVQGYLFFKPSSFHDTLLSINSMNDNNENI